MNLNKQVSPYTLVFLCLGICILFSGCVQTYGGKVGTSEQLTSVPHNVPHGTLTVKRGVNTGDGFLVAGWTGHKDKFENVQSNRILYEGIYVKVDSKVVFKETDGPSATILLAPGKHEVEAWYYSRTFQKTSPVIKGVVEVKENGTASVGVLSNLEKIFLTCEPKPGTGSETGAGTVRGVLINREMGTPVKNATIDMLKVKSVEGGKVTLELDVSADGKMLGGLSTKTDSAGAFRFERVDKGSPYVLGAVDQTGKNIVVILKENDNVKDLGTVYQKKQPDKKKP